MPTATVQRANKDGTMKINIPKGTLGPDGDELEPGDKIVYSIDHHKKPEDTNAGE
jgi:hypothetical protein